MRPKTSMLDQASNSGATVTIVTHRGLPDGAPDDILLADAIARLGATSRFAAWDDPDVCWTDTPLAIVRSTWDFHRSPELWLNWAEQVADLTSLANPAAVLRWNMDKRYLRYLADMGVDCIPTAFVEPVDAVPLRSILQAKGWTDVVVKPAIGASASGARRFPNDMAIAAGEAHLTDLLTKGAVLVQPYLDVVETERERSLVFVDGSFAHAFTKPAFNTDAAGGTTLLPHAPTTAELALANLALKHSPGRLLYARVDMVLTSNGPSLMELELIEPDLGLRLDKTVAARLAGVCLDAATKQRTKRVSPE